MIITIIIVFIAFMLGIVAGVFGFKYILLDAMKKENADRKKFGRYISYYKGTRFPRLKTREEAENILGELDNIINLYGQVSITELKELLGVTASNTEYRFGWKNIDAAHAVRTYNGYMLRLPETVILDTEASTNA